MDSETEASQEQAQDGGPASASNVPPKVDGPGTQEETSGDSRVPTTISQEDKQVLRDKMKDMFAKFIANIDNHVLDVGKSQCELDSQLDRLIETLDSIKIDEKLTADISENAKRISTLKSRLTVIHTILSDASARCGRTLAACGAAIQNTSAVGSSAPASMSLSPSSPTKHDQGASPGHS